MPEEVKVMDAVSAGEHPQKQRDAQRVVGCARCGSANVVWFTPPSATYAGHILLCARCHRLTIALSHSVAIDRRLVGQPAASDR